MIAINLFARFLLPIIALSLAPGINTDTIFNGAVRLRCRAGGVWCYYVAIQEVDLLSNDIIDFDGYRCTTKDVVMFNLTGTQSSDSPIFPFWNKYYEPLWVIEHNCTVRPRVGARQAFKREPTDKYTVDDKFVNLTLNTDVTNVGVKVRQVNSGYGQI